MDTPRLYSELAEWWPLLSAPGDYDEEAGYFRELLVEACNPRTVLELGSGGGNNASHLKRHFDLTLVDRSPQMLAVSRALNPECEHVAGDMRSIRLGRQFDAKLGIAGRALISGKTQTSADVASDADFYPVPTDWLVSKASSGVLISARKLMSAPETNAFVPKPVSTAARMLLSSRMASKCFCSWSKKLCE